MVVSGVGSGVSHDEKVLAMKKTSAAPFRHSLISPKCAGITTSDALKSMRTNSYQRKLDLPMGYAGREPKFSQAQKAAAVEHYLTHDQCIGVSSFSVQ